MGDLQRNTCQSSTLELACDMISPFVALLDEQQHKNKKRSFLKRSTHNALLHAMTTVSRLVCFGYHLTRLVGVQRLGLKLAIHLCLNILYIAHKFQIV